MTCRVLDKVIVEFSNCECWEERGGGGITYVPYQNINIIGDVAIPIITYCMSLCSTYLSVCYRVLTQHTH